MPSGVMVRAVPPPGSQPGQVMQICDPGAKTPDSVYIDKAYKMMQQGSFRYAKLKKFSSKTGCSIMPGTRCQQFPAGFHLNVFVEGTTVARYCWVEGHRDDDGRWHEGHYTHSETAFIDQTCFQLLQEPAEKRRAYGDCGVVVPGELEEAISRRRTRCSRRLGLVELRVQAKEFWDRCLGSLSASRPIRPEGAQRRFSKTFTGRAGRAGTARTARNRRGNGTTAAATIPTAKPQPGGRPRRLQLGRLLTS